MVESTQREYMYSSVTFEYSLEILSVFQREIMYFFLCNIYFTAIVTHAEKTELVTFRFYL